MKDFSQLANKEAIDKTIENLKANGMDAKFVENKEQAKKEILGLLPQGAEVLTMTSITLEQLEILPELNDSEKYNSLRKKLNNMDRSTQGLEMQKLGAAPEWVIGSVHAVTEDGHIIVASNTGSQLPAYSYGSANVVWVIGTQKIVKNVDEGMRRLYEYVLPLESKRANKAYNMTHGSFVSKLLIINREVKPGRVNIIFVGENLGF